jgi:ERCC4-type nuclease
MNLSKQAERLKRSYSYSVGQIQEEEEEEESIQFISELSVC